MYIKGTNNSSAGGEVVIGGLAYYESDRVDVTTTREPQPYKNHQLTINKGVSQETSDWEIGEILVFNKKLNADEEQSVVSYLERTFYGPDGYDPVGNNREMHLPRHNLKLSDVYSMMDPSALQIEYFHKQDYDRIIDLSSTMDLGIGDMSHAIIKTDDLRNRLLSTDASFTNMFGDKMGYEHNSIVRLSDFRGAHFGGSGEGGTEMITYSSGGISYKVHKFTTAGPATFVVSGTIKADFLIVAGGGGGGMDMGGGGGGGGVVAGTEYELGSGTYTITVGHGGMGAPPGSINDFVNAPYPAGQGRTTHQFQFHGNNGNDSSIVSGALNGGAGFIAKGGGYGGSSYHLHFLGAKPNSGGSGGGGGAYNNSGSLIPTIGSSEHKSTQDTYTSIAGVTGYGYPGGQSSGSAWYGSGGGGAGETGLTATSSGNVYPRGGHGIQISWVTPEALNVTGESHGHGVADATPFYWAGGGGGSGYSQNGGSGGDGGGGGGAAGTTTGGVGGLNIGSPGGGGATGIGPNTPGGNGGPNTGGGGGGGSHYNNNNKGGNGGSGIVVIRYKS
jgi:hypothetical protein